MLAVCSHKFKLDVSESLRLPQTSVQLSELVKLVHPTDGQISSELHSFQTGYMSSTELNVFKFELNVSSGLQLVRTEICPVEYV